jgi:hypothetical protein
MTTTQHIHEDQAVTIKPDTEGPNGGLYDRVQVGRIDALRAPRAVACTCGVPKVIHTRSCIIHSPTPMPFDAVGVSR